jgi:hypothetical protein
MDYGLQKDLVATYGMTCYSMAEMSVSEALASIPDTALWSMEHVIHRVDSTGVGSQGFFGLGLLYVYSGLSRHRRPN